MKKIKQVHIVTMLRVWEAAKLLGVAQSTLYNWKYLGKIPCYKINGCLRFSISDIESFIEKKRIGEV